MPTELIAAGVVFAIIGLLVFALTRAAKRGGEMEADLATKTATLEALARANEGAAAAVNDLRKGETPAQVKAKNDKAWGKK